MTPPNLPLESLVQHLEHRQTPEDQIRLLSYYLQDIPPETLALALTVFLERLPGNRLTIPALKTALFERINPDLFEASRQSGTDLSETLALLWPGGTGSFDLVKTIQVLQTASKPNRLESITHRLDGANASARDLIIRIATARFRSPVTPDVMRQALARAFDKPRNEIEQNLANTRGAPGPFAQWLHGARFVSNAPREDRFISPPVPRAVSSEETANYDLAIALPAGEYSELIASSEVLTLRTLAGDRVPDYTPPTIHPGPGVFLAYRASNPATPLLLLDVLAKDGIDVSNRSHTERCSSIDGIGPFQLPPVPLANRDVLFLDPLVDRFFLVNTRQGTGASHRGPAEILRPPRVFHLMVLYVEGPVSRAGHFDGTVTLGVMKPGTQDQVPVGKAPVRSLTHEDKTRLETFIAEHTLERFGPVRKLSATSDVFLGARVSCRSIKSAPRRKARLVLEDPILIELNPGEHAPPMTTLDELTTHALL